MLTRLPIERHACEIDFRTNGDVDHCRIRQRDKRSNTVVEATVSVNHLDGSINCSCGHFNRHVEGSINLIRNDPDKLRVFLSKVKDLKQQLEIDASS
nr:FAR1 DNA binding domain-containing protein [Tanacetum cinerariifolium]